MGKLTKNQKLALEKIEAGKTYTLKEAAELVKEITYYQIRCLMWILMYVLGVDPRKANQMVRGVVSFLTEQANKYGSWILYSTEAESCRERSWSRLC